MFHTESLRGVIVSRRRRRLSQTMLKKYCCPVNIDNSLSDRLLHLYKPLIEIQPKEYRISMFKRTRISRISRTKGRVSQTMRDEYFLIRGEYHEFYHPDGIRAIRMR